MRMPTNRNEDYRFTDISQLLQNSLGTAATAGAGDVAAAHAARGLKQAAAATVVVVDGVVNQQLSSTGHLPAGVFVGDLTAAPQDVVGVALVSMRGTSRCCCHLAVVNTP